ncbi:MAG TPA: excinuclease ABC subunit UvrC [Thermoleophilia bacterium]|nr:excinuclease ABC subunit UvrC [Thermoleophilia bacterium]
MSSGLNERPETDPLTSLRETARRAPAAPGVYRWLDGDGLVLYVGKAKDLRKRLSSYFRGGAAAPGVRTAEMVTRARAIEYVVTGSETEALLLEDNFIKESRPLFNLRLRDDKSYPYIEITLNDEWPRVRFFRGRHVPGNLYFGPYSSARKVRETLDLIGRIFPYRKCKGEKPGRPTGSPCLQYFINRSLGVCDDCVSREEYMEVVDQVIDFLRGRLTEVGRSIERDMRAAAAAQEFEKAALLRDRLEAVLHVQEGQSVEQEGAGSFDVVGLWQGEPGGNVQVFHVREGALVARQTFYVENSAGREPRELIDEFLLEYYGDGVTIPGQVIVPADDGAAELSALLSSRRGSRVEVRRAQRGPKRRLLEMAQRNAAEAADEEQARLARTREAREEALVRLRDALGLADLPLRIECYDISNLGERHPVASMVVFEDGRPRKGHYRKFAIRTVAGQDDFAMMREVVARRFRRLAASTPISPDPGLPGDGSPDAGERDGAPVEDGYDESFASRPSLIVIDGGKGQLSAAREGLAEAAVEVPAVGLAKQREEVFVPGRSAPLALAPDDPASLLLQRIRDEAHRFAVTFHRQRRGGDLRRASIFDELPKVGPVRRRAILEHFGSPERFLAASREEIERVPGLPRRVAREIYAQLHKAG